MSDVEANLRSLIKSKRRQLDSANSALQRVTLRRDSLHNQVIELESLLDRDASPDDDQVDTSADRFRA